MTASLKCIAILAVFFSSCSSLKLLHSPTTIIRKWIVSTTISLAGLSAIHSLDTPQSVHAAIYPDTVLGAMAEKPAAGAQIFGLKGGRLLSCSARSNCISTSSIKSVEKYSRPWSFSTSPQDQFEKIVSMVKENKLLTLEEADEEKLYVHITAKSSVPPTSLDDIEFLINPQDKIITYRSNSRDVVFAGTQQLSDGGSNKYRLQQLQRKLAVKDMGDYGSDVDEYFQNNNSGLPFDGLLPSANLFKYQSMANEPSDILFLDNKPEAVVESLPRDQ